MYKRQALRFAELIYYGQWFHPLREALQALVSSTQTRVAGRVRLRLCKGAVTVIGRVSAESLYREDLATFGEDDVYDQKDAGGFIRLFGLPMKVQAMLRGASEEAQALTAPDHGWFKRD